MNGMIIKMAQREHRLGNHFWLAANDVSDPKEKKKLEKRAQHHYTKAYRIKQQKAA